ncbi:MAG: M48 family metallopeptidase [Treponema sp.]|nr:M48 family metallopeptidase [Treponema sp.]
MKKAIYILLFIILIFSGCATNPVTGKTSIAIIPNSMLFPMSFTQYDTFLRENSVVRGTAEAQMLTRVGMRLADAAQKLLAAEGQPNYLSDYRWEFTLIRDNSINAWAMPGGKIVFYTGILPVTRNETGIAVVMGHEIAHQILNHGQQRMSADLLQQIGAIGVAVATSNQSPETQALIMTAYGVGSELGGTLPFSRQHEYEADRYGLLLMAIAGYNPDEAIVFWERMSSMGGGSVPEFLSTHPSDANRIRNLRNFAPEAKQRAVTFGVTFN